MCFSELYMSSFRAGVELDEQSEKQVASGNNPDLFVLSRFHSMGLRSHSPMISEGN